MTTMRARQVPRAVAFWIVATAFFVLMSGAAAPSPLYSVYQEQWGFSSITLTVIFAVYVVALLTSLLTVGALSDHIGRKPVLAASLVTLAVAMVVFVLADSVPWLIAARILQGLATGAATGAFTATVIDLQPDESRGPLLNSIAPTAGLATGALGSGLLVQFAPAPMTLVYVVLAIAYLAFAALVAAMPEPTPADGFASRAHLFAALRPKVSVPPAIRRTFTTIVPCLIASWSLGGLYLSLSPSITASVFDVRNHVIGGAEIFTLFGAGAFGAYVARNTAPRIVMVGGSVTLAAGVGITVTSLLVESIAVFFVGAAVSGFGFGTAFLGAMKTLGALTLPHERGQVFATVFAVSYTAFSVPAVIAGFAIGSAGLLTTAEVYSAAVIAFALLAALAFTLLARREAQALAREECLAAA